MSRASDRQAMAEVLAGYSLIGVHRLAGLLGVEVDEVVRRVHDNQLPAIRLGRDIRLVRFDPIWAAAYKVTQDPKVDVERYLESMGDDGWKALVEAFHAIPKTYVDTPLPEHGYVYLIETIEGPHRVKVGYSTQPERRFRALATPSPVALRLRCAWIGTVSDERRIHKLAAAHRVTGEWFNPEAIAIAESVMAERDKEFGE